MSRNNCGDCANLGEQLDQCEEDAEEFCRRIAQLEAENSRLRVALAITPSLRRAFESGTS